MKNNFPNSQVTIHLDLVSSNVKSLRDKVQQKRFLAVVKLDAYSHGARDIARHVQDQVDYFATATVDEAIGLRMGGITRPILVFGVPTYENAAAYQTHGLTATISHQTHFSVLMDGTSYHLNFDTGMGRLGFHPNQADEVRQLAIANSRLVCSGIYSHYATSDDPGSNFVYTQQERFKAVLASFSEVPLVHMSNTGAICNYGDIDHFGMVRSGLGMLGYNPGKTRHNWLQPVLSWTSTVVQVRQISKGDPVSYSSTWTAPEDGFLATIPVGYGDGVPRSLSNKLQVEIKGNLYPQVGNVTMDYLMVFLGQDRLAVSSQATLLGGNGLDAQQWSELGQTNAHEILSNLKDRVERVYR